MQAQTAPHEQLAVRTDEISDLHSSLTQSWNSAVKTACRAAVREEGSGQSLDTISKGIKNLTDKFSR